MRNMRFGRILAFVPVLVLPMMVASAAEMDHGTMDHGAMEHDMMEGAKQTNSDSLSKLTAMPASGKAREAGADGRYLMESTSVHDNLAAQCARASRGLVMLDNAAWSRCGGKPQGAAQSANSAMADVQPMTTDHEHAGHHMP